MAIADGHISCLNMSDSEVNFVYVYNGIFVSRAMDSKETFKVYLMQSDEYLFTYLYLIYHLILFLPIVKLCKGDEANRKSAAHDMNNQKLIQSLGMNWRKD